MFKNKRFLALLLAASAVSFSANSASAAVLEGNFVASNGKVFQINNTLSVEKGNGVVWVKQSTGSVQPFPDATGAVWAKVVASPILYSKYVKVGTTDRYMNATVSTEISCLSNQTVFGYTQAQAEYFSDSCVLHATVKALSN